MYLTRRKRLQLTRIIFLLSGVLLCCIYQLTVRTRLPGPWPEPQIGENPKGGPEDATEGLVVKPGVTAKLTTGAVEEGTSTHTAPKPDTTPSTTPLRTERAKTTVLRPMTTTNRTIVRCIYVDPDLPKPNPVPTPAPEPTHPTPTIAISVTAEPPHIKGEYPQDIFTIEERRRGWVILHIFGMIYMFVSLAIVCDEFFVPTLGVITKKLEISDDVAGATFMAAGGSAPELFTSLIGVFISHSNVGIGTIVGSAVFNILFVIGMCALFSREMLYLTWWPLFRDVSFYILDLIMLIIFFLDNTIMWWESIMLVGGYAIYVYFMKYNVQIERAFKSQLRRHKNIVKVIPVEEPEKENGTTVDDNSTPEPEDKNRLKLKPTLQRGGSSASLHNSTMRNTIFQLMIHTLDPLVKFKEKAQILNSMARGKVEGKEKEKSGKGEDCNTEDTKESKEPGPAPSNKADTKEKPEGQKEEKEAAAAGEGGGSEGSEGSDDSDDDSEEDSDEDSDDEDDDQEEDDEDGEENEEPLSLEWPDTRRKQATYLFLLPIVFPLWLTVPDVRNPASRKYFVITFLGSIVWIAIFSYLMVWWAHQVGETIGISEEIMGLTILAAGTSIPDLITSVIVARKGLGDMAVSSSVGSNIFDITVGLPVPWLLFSSFHGMVPVAVSSNGLFCAIVLLFLMLLFVIISIAVCKWRMNKMLGFTMFLLYFVFLVLSVMLEDRIIVCPVSI
ncbi:sodium/potassium/calcium exchanger 1 isoform X4 [Tachysurus fulvidraco]|uniref:sodium/potassium/calcium exchanger 1 isoform X4 n=1 Tax=Tachysurus fulvidraco TaxID=1234273 RepID=UPI000F4EE0E5|nr:sodium/potassium/calcium exchanger 1 isoform X4 [Tachysurus fulvidraco]